MMLWMEEVTLSNHGWLSSSYETLSFEIVCDGTMAGAKKILQAMVLLLFSFSTLVQFYTAITYSATQEQQEQKSNEPPVHVPAGSVVSARPLASGDHSYKEEATVVVTHSPHTNGTNETCRCDLFSINCLDSIRCLRQDTRTEQYAATLGIMTREWIKQTATFLDEEDSHIDSEPIGKATQTRARDAWQSWFKHRILPKGFGPSHQSIFVNERWYPFCQKHGLHGKSCFFRSLDVKYQKQQPKPEIQEVLNYLNEAQAMSGLV